MIRLGRDRLRRTHRPAPTGRRRLRPEVARLEERFEAVVFNFAATATPNLLPPSGRYVPVRVVGTVSETEKSIVPNVNFQVVDEYRRVQPGARVVARRTAPGAITFAFAFTVNLQASVVSKDTSGRFYYIVAAARDPNGSTGKVIPVLVSTTVPRSAATTRARA